MPPAEVSLPSVAPGLPVPELPQLPRAAPEDLGVALERRLRREPGEMLRTRSARVVLDAGDDGSWVVTLRRGRPLGWHAGRDRNADAVIMASVDTLVGLVDGTISGVKAFIDGDVTIRGDVGLVLALDGVFVHEERDTTWARTRLVHVRDGRRNIATATIGAGNYDDPPIVMLHGLGATGASLLPLQWELASDHRVHAPDLPGFGDSGKPLARYDAAFFVRWLTGYLDALEIDRCILVGNSLGGRIAIEAGLSIPDRLRGLVLLCPSPAFRRARQLIPLVRMIPSEIAFAPTKVPHTMVVELIKSMLSVPERLPQVWYDAGADEFGKVWREAAARRAFLAAARQIYLEQAYGEQGFWDRLPKLEVPSLFVWGDRDRLVPASFARHVAQALPESASIVMEDCGHVPQMELPEETAAVVRGFLAQLD